MDEHSSDIQVTTAKFLKSVDMFGALILLVDTRNNVYGHKVVRIVSDALPPMEPVVPMLAVYGFLLTFAPQGNHAAMMKRSVQGQDGRRWEFIASLPFLLPMIYIFYAYVWVADNSNGLPNSHSHPSCADIIVTDKRRTPHYECPCRCFGATCMVSVFEQKCRREASLLAMAYIDVHRSEPAICLGYSKSTPGTYDFILALSVIVPRAVVTVVQFHPFDWVVHKVLIPFWRLLLVPFDVAF